MRYILADEGLATYGIESSAYTKATDATQYLGYLTEDIDFPGGQNPHTVHSSGGTARKPYNQSPEPREYEFDIPVLPYDENIPLEIAMGERSQEDILNDSSDIVGAKHKFRLANQLPTATIQHEQNDLNKGFREWFIGTKAGLSFEVSVGDPLSITLNCVAAKHDYTYDETTPTDIDLPRAKPLFMFWNIQNVTLGKSSFLAVSGVSASLDNGLEALRHGENDRDAYAVAEGSNADLFDVTLNANIIDNTTYLDAVDNEAKVDIELPFVRGQSSDGTINDAIYLRLKNCKILTSDIPFQSEGHLTHDIEVSPESMEIDILSPEEV